MWPFARHELRVPDLDEAERFYGELFGWTFEDNPMGSTILAQDGTVLGGVSPVKRGLPNHWTPYIACDDVDAVADRARRAGGVVTSGEPADVPGVGRLAPILDAGRSIFVALTPRPTIRERQESFVWDRLVTADLDASAAFYREAFGWTAQLGPGGGVFEADGVRIAELVEGEPGGWLPFVGVEDLAAARELVTSRGGAATSGEVELTDGGRYAVVTDSQGVVFAVHVRV